MLKRDFSKKETYLFVFISLGVVVPINLFLEGFVSLWSLSLIPIIALLHTSPNWKTGIISILGLLVVEISIEIYFPHNISKGSIQELIANCITNTNIILIMTFFRLKNVDIQILDPLTKAYNRRFCNTFLQKRSNLKNLSVQIIDIDHFKRINDTYGHPCGDYILVEIVKVIKKEIRKTDNLVRLGGEEFCILSPNTSSEEGYKIAQRIRELVESTQFIYDNQLISITVSIGLANQKEENEPNQLVKNADKALYNSKQNGRNQVTCYN